MSRRELFAAFGTGDAGMDAPSIKRKGGTHMALVFAPPIAALGLGLVGLIILIVIIVIILTRVL
jgi:hypothetical protein